MSKEREEDFVLGRPTASHDQQTTVVDVAAELCDLLRSKDEASVSGVRVSAEERADVQRLIEAATEPCYDALFSSDGRTLTPFAQTILAPAAKALRDGEVVAFPTETVYGLGASIYHPSAIDNIFKMKGRPNDNPLIVHLASREGIANLVAEIPPAADILAAAFMPGPLTLVLKRSNEVDDAVTAGLDTVGVRVPEPAVARALLTLAGVPVAAPSANVSGHPSPTTAAHVVHDLDGFLPYVVDGGPCRVGLESTVLDLTGPSPRVLRPGAVTAEDILAALDQASIDFDVPGWRETLLSSGHQAPLLAKGETPAAPGMKYRHYAPQAQMILVSGDSVEQRTQRLIRMIKGHPAGGHRSAVRFGIYVGDIIARELERSGLGSSCEIFCYGEDGDPVEASHHLFEALRHFDDCDVSLIIAESLSEQGLGAAYMNRLRKAAGCPPQQ